MTGDTWEPPEYTYPLYHVTIALCDHCGGAVLDTVKHTQWHFRGSVRGRDSYGADLCVTEQQVKDYGYND